MPTSEDRVVQMRFENKDFEKNIAASQKSLELFEKTLAMNDGEKGLKQLNKALNDLDTTQAVTGLQNVTEKLSALETVATGALLNIGYKFENILSRGISSLSVDQIAAGWQKYADITSSTQTIMAATRSQFEDTGVQMSYVNEQLDRLNTFTDETSYNLTEMTNNIGKFTSQGIKLDTAVTAMQGIATWAAISGANSEQASRAMYNLSQALATGSVKLIDWRSIENANMATVEFKQTVLDTAVSLGTLTKAADGTYKTLDGAAVSVSNFNAELSKGWFSSEVLLKSLDKYGGFSTKLTKYISSLNITATQFLGMVDALNEGILEQNEDYIELSKTIPDLKNYIDDLASSEYDLGRRAFKAAQEAKTFAEAINATKDAVSTGWMKTFQLIFGDYDKAKGLWTDVAEELYDLFAESANERNRVLQLWNQNYGYQDLMDGLRALWDFLMKIKNTIVEAWKAVFPDVTAKDLIILTRRFKLWAESLKDNEDVFKTFASVTTLFAKALKFVFNVIKGLRLFIAPIWQQVKILIQNVSGFVRLIADGAGDILGFENGLDGLRLAFLALGAAVAFPLKLINAFIDWLKTLGNKTLPQLQKEFDDFFNNKLPEAWKKFKNVFKSAGSDIASGFTIGLLSGIGAIFDAAGTIFVGLITFVKDIFGIASPSKVFILIGTMLIAGLVSGLIAGKGNLITGFVTIYDTISKWLSVIGQAFKTAWESVSGWFTNVGASISDTFKKIEESQGTITQGFNTLSKSIKNIAASILLIGIAIATIKGVSVFSNLADSLWGLSKAANKWATSLKITAAAEYLRALGETVLEVSLAVILLVGAFVLLTEKMDTAKAAEAGKALGIIAGSLFAFVAGIMILNKVLSAGEAVVSKLATEKGGWLGKILGGLVVEKNAYNTTAKDLLRIAIGITFITGSVAILAAVFIKLTKVFKEGEFTSEDAWKAIGFMAASLALMVGAVILLGKFSNKSSTGVLKAGLSVLTLFLSIKLTISLIEKVIKEVSEKVNSVFIWFAKVQKAYYAAANDPELQKKIIQSAVMKVVAVAAAIFTIINVMVGLLVLISVISKNASVKPFLSLAAVFAAMAIFLKITSKIAADMSMDQVIKFGIIFVFTAMLMALFNLFDKLDTSGVKHVAAIIMSLSVLLAEVSILTWAMSALEPNAILNMVEVLGMLTVVLLAGVYPLIKACAKIKEESFKHVVQVFLLINTMLAIMGGTYALLTWMSSLNGVNMSAASNAFVPMVLSLAVIIGGLSTLAYLIDQQGIEASAIKNLTKIVVASLTSLVVVAGVYSGLAAIMGTLTNVKFGDVGELLLEMSAFILVFTAALMAIAVGADMLTKDNAASFSVAVAALATSMLTLVASVAAISGILILLSKYDSSKLREEFDMLVELITILAIFGLAVGALGTILSALGPEIGGIAAIIFISLGLSLIEFSLAVLILAKALEVAGPAIRTFKLGLENIIDYLSDIAGEKLWTVLGAMGQLLLIAIVLAPTAALLSVSFVILALGIGLAGTALGVAVWAFVSIAAAIKAVIDILNSLSDTIVHVSTVINDNFTKLETAAKNLNAIFGQFDETGAQGMAYLGRRILILGIGIGVLGLGIQAIGNGLRSIGEGLEALGNGLDALTKRKNAVNEFTDFLSKLARTIDAEVVLAIQNLGFAFIMLSIGSTLLSVGLIALSVGLSILSLAFWLAETVAGPLIDIIKSFSSATIETVGHSFALFVSVLMISAAFAALSLSSIALGIGFIVLGVGVAALSVGFFILGIAGGLILTVLDGLKDRHPLIYANIVDLITVSTKFFTVIIEGAIYIAEAVTAILKFMSEGLIGGLINLFGGKGQDNVIKSVDSLVAGVNDELEIASPSHVMYETGEYMGEGMVYGFEDTIHDQSWRVIDAVRKMTAEAKEAAEEELSDIDYDPSSKEGIKNRYRQYQEKRQRDEEAKIDTLKELGASLGSVFSDNWKKLTKGEITIGQALGNVFTALKETGGEYLGNKISDLKKSLLGEGGLLSGFKDLFGGKSLEDLFKGIDLDKMLEEVQKLTDSVGNIKLDDFSPVDTSGLANAAGGSQYSTSNYTFTQNNYSPKALSRIELYRQTSRQFNNFKVKESLAK